MSQTRKNSFSARSKWKYWVVHGRLLKVKKSFFVEKGLDKSYRGVKSMEEDVKKAIEEIKPHLQADGGDVEFVEVTEDGVVKVLSLIHISEPTRPY